MAEGEVARVKEVRPAGLWLGPARDLAVLTYDDRHRRRIMLTCASGRRILLDLAETTVIRHGDGLITEAGEIIAAQAAQEKVLDVSCRDARELVRIAWHLGNRHLPTQILGNRLRIRADHVIEDMLRKLGAQVTSLLAPFDPEGGAYEPAHSHGHSHAHGNQPASNSHATGHRHRHD